MSRGYEGRLAVQQRVLPGYRIPFFDLLARACTGGMSLYAGSPRENEDIVESTPQIAEFTAAQNIHLLSGSLYLCYQQGFIKWLENWNPDALIVEANPRYLATSSAVRWMHRRGRKVIGWGLGAPPLSSAFAGMRRTSRIRFIHQFDSLIAYSRRGAEEYASLGFPPEKIFVATNAVAPRPAEAPKRKRRTSEPPTILFVGRLQARKRVDSLLRACANLPEPQPRLIVVGDGQERQTLELLAKRVYPLAEFPGDKHGEELKSYFSQSDLFVLPGTGGLAVQEAMANGLPIIVAKGDGTQDDLVREGNGWQIAAYDDQALVTTLKLALSDGKRLRKMGAESYRIVSEEINLEKMVDVFVTALKGLH